jgi:hypothetical protein
LGQRNTLTDALFTRFKSVAKLQTLACKALSNFYSPCDAGYSSSGHSSGAMGGLSVFLGSVWIFHWTTPTNGNLIFVFAGNNNEPMIFFWKRRNAKPLNSDARTNSARFAARNPGGAKDQERWAFPWQSLLLGGLAFILATGGTILNPENLGWLMHGDHSTYLLGWMFFRNTPILQQPLGANWPYGMEMSNSIVFPDGVPLMALLLKPFKALLPQFFQYFGVWILVCYLLQSLFAWKILDRLTTSVWHKIFGTIFFVLAPPFVFRLSPHFALGSHWLLLAALYLYLSPRIRSGSWILLVTVASLVNPYLLAMTLLFFGAALAKHYTCGELRISQGLKTVAVTGAILLFVMWEAGYFMVSTVGTGGFGFYRTSLLGFLDPNVGGSWSHFLGPVPQMAGNGEGFCFLGIGAILLTIVALSRLMHSGFGSIEWRGLWPLVLVFCFSALYALSNNIAIGPHIIFHYEVPSALDRITSALRASGRFIWPAYYLLVAGVLAIVLKEFGARASLLLIGFCSLAQVADSWDALGNIRNSYQVRAGGSGNHPSLLNSPFWQRVAHKYKTIACVPPQNVPEPQDEPENYFPLCFFAATHNLTINMAYLARVDEGKFESAKTNLIQSVGRCELDPKTLYVFERPAFWGSCALRMPNNCWAGIIDGYKIIAPAWKSDQRNELRSTIGNALPTYKLGESLQFASGSEGARFLGEGWSSPEPWGVWSDGSDASILLWLGREPESDIRLQLGANGFVSEKCPEQKIDVSINYAKVGELTYTLQNPNRSQSVYIPRSFLVGRRGLIEIDFHFRNCVSPADLGLSSESRKIALGLNAIVLKPAAEASTGLPSTPASLTEDTRVIEGDQ